MTKVSAMVARTLKTKINTTLRHSWQGRLNTLIRSLSRWRREHSAEKTQRRCLNKKTWNLEEQNSLMLMEMNWQKRSVMTTKLDTTVLMLMKRLINRIACCRLSKTLSCGKLRSRKAKRKVQHWLSLIKHVTLHPEACLLRFCQRLTLKMSRTTSLLRHLERTLFSMQFQELTYF